MKWFTEEEKMKRMKKSHCELAGTLDKPGLNATIVDVSLNANEKSVQVDVFSSTLVKPHL